MMSQHCNANSVHATTAADDEFDHCGLTKLMKVAKQRLKSQPRGDA